MIHGYVTDPSDLREPAMDPPILELREVGVVRGATRILDGVSLTLRRGEHTAILGPNGSGKSTLVKLISGQIYPSAPPAIDPPIRVFGRERWNLEELRSRLGLVSADVHHRFMSGSSMGRATAMELVLASFFGAGRIFLHHEVTDEQRSRAREALAKVDATGVADRRLGEMSSGEARRVLIARALVHRPEVLVLDEPTTGLDLVARREFLHTLRRLAAEEATLILVTHHIEEIVPEVRRVVLMRGGRVAADGPPERVLTADTLSDVFGARVEPVRRDGRYELRFEEG